METARHFKDGDCRRSLDGKDEQPASFREDSYGNADCSRLQPASDNLRGEGAGRVGRCSATIHTLEDYRMKQIKSAPSPSILIAEDDRVTCEVIARLLAKNFPGVGIFAAENGRVGVELFKEHTPDIVITDISMPVMDGIRMAGEIKAAKADTKFIVLTAYSGDECYLDKFRKIGFSDYLSKPIEFGKLFAAVEKCINEIGVG